MKFEELEKEYYKSIEKSNKIEIETKELKEEYDRIEEKIETEFQKFLDELEKYKKYLCLNVSLKNRILSKFEIKNVIFEFDASYNNELKTKISTTDKGINFDIHLNGNDKKEIFARYYNPERIEKNYFNAIVIINKENIYEYLNEYSNLIIKQYIKEQEEEKLKQKENLQTIYCFKDYKVN